MNIRIMAAALILGAGAPAFAQSGDIDGQGMGACFKLPEGQEAGCVADMFAVRDDELNFVYGAALDYIRNAGDADGTKENQLRIAQRSWIEFRDQACLLEAGPPRELPDINHEHYFCLDRLTQRRTDDLLYFIAL